LPPRQPDANVRALATSSLPETQLHADGMAKIKVKTSVVKLDGDEMPRIIWGVITDKRLAAVTLVRPATMPLSARHAGAGKDAAEKTRPGCPGRVLRTQRQSAASAAFSVALGRIAADALAGSGR
jgi:hypothetical protein